jgi:hypothetical protein
MLNRHNKELKYWEILKYYKKRKQETENGSPVDFPWSVYYLFIVKTKVCCLSVVDEERNKRRLSVCKRAKQA